jgi:CheY-like chemotaxis protein
MTAPLRILVVEDDLAIVDSLAEVLTDEGFEVATVENGRAALAHLEANPLPGVILLDLMMPEMDGYEFRRQQLARPPLAAIPTIVMTAGLIDARIEAMQVDGWLRKPVHLDALLAGIRKLGAQAPIAQDHAVLFYQDEARLCARVADFLAAGIAAGEAAIAVATRPHAETIRRALAARGLDAPALEAGDRLRFVDAEETLAELLVNGAVHPARFQQIGRAALARASAAAPAGRVRVFGEMVDLLWRRGDLAGAARLEALWADLQAGARMSLLCSYAIAASRPSAAELRQLCGQHGERAFEL